MLSRIRRAFTLIELLCVIAIIGLLASIVAGLSAKPPHGLDGATNLAQSIFAQARATAQLGNDPDIALSDAQKKTTPLRFIRTRVLVNNDPADQDRYLRYMLVLVGGYRGTDTTKSEKNLQESDLVWYAFSESKLPEGFYFVGSDAQIAGLKTYLKSDVVNKTFGPGSMKFQLPITRTFKKSGSGSNFFYYEYLNSGVANMTDSAEKTGARFIITQGIVNPATHTVQPDNNSAFGGFIVLRPGTTLSINNKFDL